MSRFPDGLFLVLAAISALLAVLVALGGADLTDTMARWF